MLSNLVWMAYGYRILFSEILQNKSKKYFKTKKNNKKYNYFQVFYLFCVQKQFATIKHNE